MPDREKPAAVSSVVCQQKAALSCSTEDGWRIHLRLWFSLRVWSSVAQLAVCLLCLKVAPFHERTSLLVLMAAPRSIRSNDASILACCPLVILFVVPESMPSCT